MRAVPVELAHSLLEDKLLMEGYYLGERLASSMDWSSGDFSLVVDEEIHGKLPLPDPLQQSFCVVGGPMRPSFEAQTKALARVIALHGERFESSWMVLDNGVSAMGTAMAPDGPSIDVPNGCMPVIQLPVEPESIASAVDYFDVAWGISGYVGGHTSSDGIPTVNVVLDGFSMFFIQACDGEAYLVWTRRESSQGEG